VVDHRGCNLSRTLLQDRQICINTKVMDFRVNPYMPFEVGVLRPLLLIPTFVPTVTANTIYAM
jgi:hypothetical protein